MLHWAGGAGGRGIVCAGDILTVTTDRKWLSFMRSYPNFVPLSARTVRRVVVDTQLHLDGERFDVCFLAHRDRYCVATECLLLGA